MNAGLIEPMPIARPRRYFHSGSAGRLRRRQKTHMRCRISVEAKWLDDRHFVQVAIPYTVGSRRGGSLADASVSKPSMRTRKENGTARNFLTIIPLSSSFRAC